MPSKRAEPSMQIPLSHKSGISSQPLCKFEKRSSIPSASMSLSGCFVVPWGDVNRTKHCQDFFTIHKTKTQSLLGP